MNGWIVGAMGVVAVIVGAVIGYMAYAKAQREAKNYERGLKMVPMLIHLPPSTDDIEVGGRDERDVTEEALSEAQVMYSIIASTAVKGFRSKIHGQRHMSFEIVASEGLIKYYAVVPAVLTETIKQAIAAAYPTARLEEVEEGNIFSVEGKMGGTVGGELVLKKEFVYPIATYQETKRDASMAILNALSSAKKGDGVAVQVLLRPADGGWTKKSIERVESVRSGKKKSRGISTLWYLPTDIIKAFWEPPELHEKKEGEEKPLTNLQTAEIEAIEGKTKFPGFEVLIRLVASAGVHERAEVLLGGVVAAFSQFDSQANNGFKYDAFKNMDKLTTDYIFRFFPQGTDSNILNSVELASIFHLPAQNAIPTSQVERQAIKQVDGPTKLVEEGVLLGINEFRGEKKEIRLAEDDRRRHVYFIGSTGSGKSTLLTNMAYQDMCDGRGLAFIDPHGDAVEAIMSKVPPERIDDVIYFDPGNLEYPIGMNMFEFDKPDEKDFIIQEGINMLYSLYDPGHTGIFGPRGEHMFRNAALLLMSDPSGATFIDIPRVFIDSDFVKAKLKFVTDKTVFDYWTKEFPASQRSNDAGEVTTWFVSKWGPFLSNTMMRNILGQTKSGFKLREVMDSGKILLVNLSKGKMGELNSKLLGMIFVMKFQTAAMGRADMAENERRDFCLFVDEFQNYSTESFESILSEARKFRLNLVVANQFMTQLTDKIREGILGNVGTIISGRLGVTDAELMEKAFSPTFSVEDLHKLPNFHTIATVMMHSMPSAPFTMTMLPRMGEESEELLARMKEYSSARFGKPRSEVDREISARIMASGESSGSEVGEGLVSGSGGGGAVGAVVPPPVVVGTGAARGVASVSVGLGVGGQSGGASAEEGAMGRVHDVKAGQKSFLDSWLMKKAKMNAELKVVEPPLSKEENVVKNAANDNVIKVRTEERSDMSVVKNTTIGGEDNGDDEEKVHDVKTGKVGEETVIRLR
jgi:hypothetical protein